MTKASCEAEKVVRFFFENKGVIIFQHATSLQVKEDGVAVQTVTVNDFKNRLENEIVLEVNDKVTLNRRVGRNQVKGKIVKVHLSDYGKLYYNIKPVSG